MKYKYLLLLFAVAAVCPTVGAADHDDGGLPVAFALMAGDGRSLALGGAAVALDGLGAAYYNPAALATLERNTVSSTYRALSFDRRIVEVGYGRPILAQAGLGISWTNATVDDLVGTNYAGNETEEITNSQNMFVFGFGRAAGVDWVQAGVTGRFYYTALARARASGYGIDAGVRATPWEWLTAAAAVRDVATELRWSNTLGDDSGYNYAEEAPTRFLAGAGVRPWRRLLLTLQGDVGEDECWRYRAGAEFWADERIALRAGYDDGSPTLGAAVLLPQGGYTVAFDYAYVEEDFTAEAAHTVSLGLIF
jgi:hypothetical protein